MKTNKVLWITLCLIIGVAACKKKVPEPKLPNLPDDPPEEYADYFSFENERWVYISYQMVGKESDALCYDTITKTGDTTILFDLTPVVFKRMQVKRKINYRLDYGPIDIFSKHIIYYAYHQNMLIKAYKKDNDWKFINVTTTPLLITNQREVFKFKSEKFIAYTDTNNLYFKGYINDRLPRLYIRGISLTMGVKYTADPMYPLSHIPIYRYPTNSNDKYYFDCRQVEYISGWSRIILPP